METFSPLCLVLIYTYYKGCVCLCICNRMLYSYWNVSSFPHSIPSAPLCQKRHLQWTISWHFSSIFVVLVVVVVVDRKW